MGTESRVKVAYRIKEFSLKDHNGKDFNIGDHKGKRVLLSFHPLAWTPICANQMKALEENHDTFEKMNTIAVGISVDSVPCKTAWAKELGITRTSLLADFWPHGFLAKELGIFRAKEGFSDRANILVDEEGKVAWVRLYHLSELPDIKEVIETIKAQK
jgi:peroxiredoxin